MIRALARIGVIGGSAFSFVDSVDGVQEHEVDTPFGPPSSGLKIAEVGGEQIALLARHGNEHSILPHAINYRANMWALKSAGVDTVVALATVGGIGAERSPGTIVLPNQMLDYTHSREHTFSPLDGKLIHIEFTEPYCEKLRGELLLSANDAGIEVQDSGTYAATQGPRFESAAEIRKFGRDGGDIVGMTGMPEACLAREIGICYATIALVVNYAAGIGGNTISVDEIKQAHGLGMRNVNQLLTRVLPRLGNFECQVPPAITP